MESRISLQHSAQTRQVQRIWSWEKYSSWRAIFAPLVLLLIKWFQRLQQESPCLSIRLGLCGCKQYFVHIFFNTMKCRNVLGIYPGPQGQAHLGFGISFVLTRLISGISTTAFRSSTYQQSRAVQRHIMPLRIMLIPAISDFLNYTLWHSDSRSIIVIVIVKLSWQILYRLCLFHRGFESRICLRPTKKDWNLQKLKVAASACLVCRRAHSLSSPYAMLNLTLESKGLPHTLGRTKATRGCKAAE